ncbi:MAG: hypothetical protein ACRYGP_16520 [Janthinobacterium lividum]
MAEALVPQLTSRDKAKLTTWIMEQSRLGNATPLVDRYVLDEVKNASSLSIVERCDRLLHAISVLYPNVGGNFRTHGAQDDETKRNKASAAAWSESVDDSEVTGMLTLLSSNGFIRHNGAAYNIEFMGWKRLEDLRLSYSPSDQAFVAMWFDPSMNEAYTSGIEPAIRACGYASMRIDAKEHANKIDDEIIAEIRRSRFLVADFTSARDQPRGGVYYEAGFAMGLAKPVIWTCRSDMIGNVHFDTRQFNHITWTDPADLKSRLEKRIGAVIGDGPLRRA